MYHTVSCEYIFSRLCLRIGRFGCSLIFHQLHILVLHWISRGIIKYLFILISLAHGPILDLLCVSLLHFQLEGTRVEFATKHFLCVHQDLADSAIRNRDRKHHNFSFDLADLAADGGLRVLRARVLVQTRAADVVPTNHLHCLLLDLVAAQATDVQV